MSAPLPAARPQPETEHITRIHSSALTIGPTPTQEHKAAASRRGIAGDRTAIGVGALLLSTVLFPLSDMIAKTLASSYSGLEVSWMRYAVLLAVIAPMVLNNPGLLRTSRPVLQLVRGLSSTCATGLALVGFMFLPVANATAIGFCAPLIVTGLAAVILKERVGWQRWTAACVGFAGILVIVQPGGQAFQMAALLPLAASLFSASTVITTRLGRTEGVETTLAISCLVGFVLLSGAVVPIWRTPALADMGLWIVMGVLAASATFLQIVAFRCAPSSLLAPFSYAQILWAIGIGWLVFGTVPNVAMLIGSTIVIASGCSVAWRERMGSGGSGRRDWSMLRRELIRLHPAGRATV